MSTFQIDDEALQAFFEKTYFSKPDFSKKRKKILTEI